MASKSPETEILERTRRIETRLTHLSNELGVATNTGSPVFVRARGEERDRIIIPSPRASLRDCLRALPGGYIGVVDVMVGDELIAVLDRSEDYVIRSLASTGRGSGAGAAE